MTKQSSPRIAFALGGLGGFNAHGAGFLQASRQEGITPTLISCTSGQIVQTYHYLRGDDLGTLMEKRIATMPQLPDPFQPLAFLSVAMKGVAGVFRPALPENLKDLMSWPPPTDHHRLRDLMFPARVAIPTRDPEFYEKAAKTFNESAIGVVFNAFSLADGIEHLYVNEPARRMLEAEYDKPYGSKIYLPITAEAVEAALWLLPYGCNRLFGGKVLIDGAYRRQFIIRELITADIIFVPHPIGRKWDTSPPMNYFEMEDLKIELLFTGSYNGELAAIKSINYFLEKGMVSPDVFKRIDIVEIPIETRRGYFDYFFESLDVFEQSVSNSRETIRNWRNTAAAAEPAEPPPVKPAARARRKAKDRVS